MSEKLPEGWKEKTFYCVLETIVDYRGISVPKATNGIPLITARNIRDGYYDFSDQEYIDQNAYLNWVSRGKPQKNDILFTTEAPLGKACLFPEHGEYAIGQRVISLRVKQDEMYSKFLLYFILSTEGQTSIDFHATGTTAKGIKSSEVKKIKIRYPALSEQQKIAHILSTWDDAIHCTQNVLENSKKQKKALTQQLLTGRRRLPGFSEKWKPQCLKDCASLSSKSNTSNENLPVISCSKHYGFVDSLKYFNKQVFSKNLNTYKVICKGEFGYPANHIEEGAIGYQNKYDKALVSPIYVVFKLSNHVDPYFLYATLKTDAYRQKFNAATSASVDRRGSLRWPEFSKIEVLLPPLPEQKAIADVLTAADAVIQQYEAKLANLQAQKKALMQQLLTGKIRVKTDTDAAQHQLA